MRTTTDQVIDVCLGIFIGYCIFGVVLTEAPTIEGLERAHTCPVQEVQKEIQDLHCACDAHVR